MGYLDSLFIECLHHIGDSTPVLVRLGGHIIIDREYIWANVTSVELYIYYIISVYQICLTVLIRNTSWKGMCIYIYTYVYVYI